MARTGNSMGRLIQGLVVLLPAILLFGCAAPYPYGDRSRSREPVDNISEHGSESTMPLKNMGYAIQVGAFSQLDNAVRFERLLNDRGVDAYYFRHEDGLFKVRFGDHRDYGNARRQAELLQSQGLIGNFFIVLPESYASHVQKGDQIHLRNELVRTAKRFLGVPYRWGGTDSENGFDCSGLTLVCYRLNGLNLPRVSRNQFEAGRWVPKDRLQKGDLVFFATNGGRKVSHVGMYIGGDHFIHAPRTGQTVRIEKLSNPFFTRTYMGGRSYF